jgi:transcriptional regulator with XRE-family HTH domain
MHKLINLAGKIRSFRETRGLTQTEFIVAVSQKLAEITKNPSLAAKLREKPLNPSLASQWESNIKNRASPNSEQLKAIALLSDRPWDTIWWFMRDDIDYKRGYELFPDGTANIAPPDLSEQEEEEMRQYLAEENSRHEATPSKELTAWMQDEDKMWNLHVKGKFSEEEQNRQRRQLGIFSLLAHGPCPGCSGINSNFAKKCEYCGHKLDSPLAVGGKAQQVVSEVVVDKPVEANTTTTDSPVKDAPLSSASLKRLGLTVRRGPIVSDLVEFPSLPPARPQTNDNASPEDYEMETANNFWSAVKFFCSNDHRIPNEFFGQRIKSGVLSQPLAYFDGDRAIQVLYIHPTSEIRQLRKLLQTKMMELIFADRMKKRTSKKMVLVTSFQKGLKLERLEKDFEDLTKSSELLGVQVQFASGPLEAAEKISAFQTANTLID